MPLQTLELSGNQLEEVDDSLSQMKHVTELDLSGNLLKRLPDSIVKMPALSHLQVLIPSLACRPVLFCKRSCLSCDSSQAQNANVVDGSAATYRSPVQHQLGLVD